MGRYRSDAVTRGLERGKVRARGGLAKCRIIRSRIQPREPSLTECRAGCPEFGAGTLHGLVARVNVEVGGPMLTHLVGIGDRASMLVPGHQVDQCAVHEP